MSLHPLTLDTLGLTGLEFDDGVDPVSVVRYPGHYSWLVLLGTANAPGDDTSQLPPSIGKSDHHGTP